ncbi:hypothetical protein GM668_10025 [Duganella ginsengisoli]|uniref:Methyl-accepting transducer domain-containing protein n=2 Tax=Pseudoduganella ginsengisoli TaxID=1462440 RepID=A0A6L6PXY4_9BURK|nr:hypothetical protein [Pseudoduganella ginsengisoli]
MRSIVHSVQQVSSVMNEIAAASREQEVGIEQINQAVSEMDTVTQQNAALVEEAAAATDSLREMAAHLSTTVSVFNLGAVPAAAAAAGPARAKANAKPPLRLVAEKLPTAGKPAAGRKGRAPAELAEWESF